MASWLPRGLANLSPINAFPEYNGPYEVGTVDVEVPVSDLPAPCDTPSDAAPTIAFRMFYPCKKPESASQDRPVRWIPSPQRPTLAALLQFLGMTERKANLLSYVPQQMYWIKLRAHRNAELAAAPTSNQRWPVTVFSHGLAGSRNAYSYVCSNLASSGVIVIAMDHRDGSSPVQYVRPTSDSEAYTVPTNKISHEPRKETWDARDQQLRIRLWEISVAFEALMKIDAGQKVENLDRNTSHDHKKRVEVLYQFEEKMDVHRAGKVSWAGHSFGAATTAQLLKSVFYSKIRPKDAGDPLIKPNSDAAIAHQITPESPAMLLDMWGLPFQSPEQRFLWERPLPSYAPGGPGGRNVISILSEAFYNWEANLNVNKHIACGPSRSRRASVSPRLSREEGKLLPDWARLRDNSPSQDSGYASKASLRTSDDASQRVARTPSGDSAVSDVASPQQQSQKKGPHIYFVQKSQHFNQSDFGILFPWLAKRLTKAEEPERILELNNRAMVQMLRESGIEIAGENDPEILAKDASMRRWIAIPADDEDEASANNVGALTEVNKRLSVSSKKSPVLPAKDGMTMGQRVELPELEV